MTPLAVFFDVWREPAVDDRGAVDPLLPVLKDPEPAVRRQAAWAIGVLAR